MSLRMVYLHLIAEYARHNGPRRPALRGPPRHHWPLTTGGWTHRIAVDELGAGLRRPGRTRPGSRSLWAGTRSGTRPARPGSPPVGPPADGRPARPPRPAR